MWSWFLAIFLWICAFTFIRLSFKFTKEYHKNKTIEDYTPNMGLSGFGSLIGFIIEVLISWTLGTLIKIMPWWTLKIFIILIGIGFVVLSVRVLS